MILLLDSRVFQMVNRFVGEKPKSPARVKADGSTKVGRLMACLRALAIVGLVGSLAACSTPQPIPSGRFDGHYVGRPPLGASQQCRWLSWTPRADIKDGQVRLALFGPSVAPMTGIVGEDGQTRLAGWGSAPGAFPVLHVLEAQIIGQDMHGTLNDTGCEWTVILKKQTTAHATKHKVHRRTGSVPSPPPLRD